MRLLNEIGEHLLGDFEIGDHAVFHGLDGDDVAGSASEHVFGFAADGDDFAAVLVDGHDGGLVDDDALAARENQCVGGAEVNGEVGRQKTEDRPHVVAVLGHAFPPEYCGAAAAAHPFGLELVRQRGYLSG